MNIIRPLSTPGIGAQHREALPQFSKDESEKGQIAAVGYPASYLVYRCSWDMKEQRTNWNFLYMEG
jgi:hypothetical protein